ncbi:MAG: hypothetical protein AAGJ12_12395 [Bacteroidota bacterium]
MTRETFKAELKTYLIKHLKAFLPKMEGVEMRAFDIGIFPWYGYLYFSFLPTKEYNENGNHLYAGDWEYWYFNTGSGFRHSWWMEENNFNIFNTKEEKEVGEAYFRICGELLHDEEVLNVFKEYNLSEDFQFLVFNHDKATRDDRTNYYLKVMS